MNEFIESTKPTYYHQYRTINLPKEQRRTVFGGKNVSEVIVIIKKGMNELKVLMGDETLKFPFRWCPGKV